MDWVEGQQKLKALFDKYKFVLLIVALGIFFMVLPEQREQETVTVAETQTVPTESITEELTQILSQIEGVGKVRVMITEAAGEETIYQTDENRTDGENDSSSRSDTVIVSRDGEEGGLVKTVTPPVYLGAIVVCQGGGSAAVRLAVSQAVAAVTGLSTDRITVLKMK